MSDKAEIWLRNAEKSQYSGSTLSTTLYKEPLDILLRGELGAGKTTFLQGFANALGISEPLTSPTYALEQRYPIQKTVAATPESPLRGKELIHIDLYRLNEQQSEELLSSTDDHKSIRCIEWVDRAEDHAFGKTISIDLAEKNEGRELIVTFEDMEFPTREQIENWREEFHLPDPIRRHCDAVADFALQLAGDFMNEGMIVRPLALRRSAEVHDLFRFVDFKPGGGHEKSETPAHILECWEAQKKKYDGMRHEPACAAFLREQGFDALATIVEVHGLTLPSPERTTIEQKLLYYADKRMMLDTIVSLEERFDDFERRYGRGRAEGEGKIWYEEALRVERELFADQDHE